MSALRLSSHGHPTELVDLGPAVGRRAFTRYATVGGTIVTPAAKPREYVPKTAEQKAREREYQRAYWQANRDAMNEKQRAYRASRKP